MSSLTEKLAKLAEAGGTLGPVYGVMADEARALEERLKQAEADSDYWRAEYEMRTDGCRAANRLADAANARAEAAEAEIAQLQAKVATLENGGFVDTRSQRAEVARLRKALDEAQLVDIGNLGHDLHQMTRERDALRSKLERVREELAIYAQADVSNSYATTKAVCRDILAIIDGEGSDHE